MLITGRKQIISRYDILILLSDNFKAIAASENFEQNEQLEPRSAIFTRYHLSLSTASYEE